MGRSYTFVWFQTTVMDSTFIELSLTIFSQVHCSPLLYSSRKPVPTSRNPAQQDSKIITCARLGLSYSIKSNIFPFSRSWLNYLLISLVFSRLQSDSTPCPLTGLKSLYHPLMLLFSFNLSTATSTTPTQEFLLTVPWVLNQIQRWRVLK